MAGLTSLRVLGEFVAVQMADIFIPTRDDRTVILRRYARPQAHLELLLECLKPELPTQPLRLIVASGEMSPVL